MAATLVRTHGMSLPFAQSKSGNDRVNMDVRDLRDV